MAGGAVRGNGTRGIARWAAAAILCTTIVLPAWAARAQTPSPVQSSGSEITFAGGAGELAISGGVAFSDNLRLGRGSFFPGSGVYNMSWNGGTLGLNMAVHRVDDGTWAASITVRHLLPTPPGKPQGANIMFIAQAQPAQQGSSLVAPAGQCVVQVATATADAMNGSFACNAVTLLPKALSSTPDPCACATLAVYHAAPVLIDAQASFTSSRAAVTPRTDGGTPSTPAVAAGSGVGSSSSAPVGLITAGAVLVLLVAVALARRPLLAVVTGTAHGAREKKRDDRHEGGHDACEARWTAASDATSAARRQAARALGETLARVARGFDDATAALERADDAFSSIDGTTEEPVTRDEEMAVVVRILRGIGDGA